MKAINKSEIARLTNTHKTFVGRVLNGERNPDTSKAKAIIKIASEIFAEQQKIEYVKSISKKYKLNKTLLNLSK